MQILYGTASRNIDVTAICLSHLRTGNIVTIPPGDHARANYFTDPNPGVLKSVFVILNSSMQEYDVTLTVLLDVLHLTVSTLQSVDGRVDAKINDLHRKLKIAYGTFQEELYEQRMAVRFLTGNEKVLELGGNIGRNSLIIASLLNTSDSFVCMESDSQIAEQLRENRDTNGFNFGIENSALSKRKLIQVGWNTVPSEVLLPGYKWVNTITFEELNKKYNIKFDTLVLDCEGAFYFILQDMPEVLQNINLILMENDYTDITHKQFIDKVLRNSGFQRIYHEAGGWGVCYDFFFETWRKV